MAAITADNWKLFAACAAPDVEPEWWHARSDDDPVGASELREWAVAICHGCPVQLHCALDTLAREGTAKRDMGVIRAGVSMHATHKDRTKAAHELRAIVAGLRRRAAA